MPSNIYWNLVVFHSKMKIITVAIIDTARTIQKPILEWLKENKDPKTLTPTNTAIPPTKQTTYLNSFLPMMPMKMPAAQAIRPIAHHPFLLIQFIVLSMDNLEQADE